MVQSEQSTPGVSASEALSRISSSGYEERFRTIFETIALGMALIDTEGRLLDCNPALQRMLGYSKDELCRLPFGQIVTAADRHSTLRHYRNLIAGKREHFTTERRYLRRDGSLLWGHTVVSLVKSAEGDPQLAIALVEDITELKHAEEELWDLLRTDELTKLYNRRGFLALAEQQVKLAVRQQRGMLLVYADVDNLKTINDTYGHRAGDKALIATATVLRETFRDSDIVARLGGDEFVVLAIDTREEDAALVTTRLQRCLARHTGRTPLTLSWGVAHFDPAAPTPLAELIAHADTAMYAQKQQKKPRRLAE